MGVHLGKETEVAPAVEEHLPYNLGENTLGCTGYTGVVKQVAGLVFGLGEEVSRVAILQKVSLKINFFNMTCIVITKHDDQFCK